MSTGSTLLLRRSGSVLYVTLNQPAARNALSRQMVTELCALARQCMQDDSLRCIVLRGAGGNFCAGGSFTDFQAMTGSAAPPGSPDPIALANRKFGSMLEQWCALPQVLVVVVEGAAMGGGFGLVAISDIALADAGARFAMPEVSLGLPPAQIAPFVVRRIGEAQTRRLALTAARIDAAEANEIGLVQQVTQGAADLDEALHATLRALLRCAPRALASTKALLAHGGSLGARLDFAALKFAEALRSGDADEGVRAFSEKRAAAWTEQPEPPERTA
jgi:isohexenylglutaconyl-CoA hydratase